MAYIISWGKFIGINQLLQISRQVVLCQLGSTLGLNYTRHKHQRTKADWSYRMKKRGYSYHTTRSIIKKSINMSKIWNQKLKYSILFQNLLQLISSWVGCLCSGLDGLPWKHLWETSCHSNSTFGIQTSDFKNWNMWTKGSYTQRQKGQKAIQSLKASGRKFVYAQSNTWMASRMSDKENQDVQPFLMKTKGEKRSYAWVCYLVKKVYVHKYAICVLWYMCLYMCCIMWWCLCLGGAIYIALFKAHPCIR